MDARADERLPAGDARNEVFALVCRHVRKLVGAGAPDYDDIVQAAAERALRDLPKFEGRSSLSTWIARVCYSSLVDYRRRHRRWLTFFTLGFDFFDTPAGDPAAEETLEWRERNRRLQSVLRRMGPKRATVVALHDLQGLSIDAIAEMLEINVMTARSRLRDGRNEIARRLKGDPYFGDVTVGKRKGGTQ